MKISALKHILIIIILSIIFTMLDVFLILHYGFNEQLFIFVYVMISLVPLCGILSLCSNLSVPTITIDYNSKTIITDFVANELCKNDVLRNQGDVFYFDEVINCETDNKKMFIMLRYGRIKTLHLNLFTKGQIAKIKKEIDKIVG